MKLPTGHFIQVRRVGTHAKHGRVLMLIDFWRSEADHDAGLPPVTRHDCTFGFGGRKHDSPGEEIVTRIVSAIDSLMYQGHVCPELMSHWQDGHDPEGNWAHPSMRQFDPVPE